MPLPSAEADFNALEKQELKLLFSKGGTLKEALAKFCAVQMWRFREEAYNSAEHNLRQSDKKRGAAEAYQDFLNELQATVKRL